MSYKRESLEKLLLLLEEICNDEENLWFKNRLHEQFSEIGDNFPSYFRHLKKQYKIKANTFYKDIPDNNLKVKLTQDYVEMSWYLGINDVNRFCLFTYYQIENLLNYYITESNAFEKIKTNKNYFIKQFNEKFTVVCFDKFFQNETNQSLDKINIWAKIVYWALDSNSEDWENQNHSNISNLVNIRNTNSHRNSTQGPNEKNEETLKYLARSDYSNFGFYANILKKIRDSLNKISTKVELKRSGTVVEKPKGPTIVGNIDLSKVPRK